MFHPKQLSSVSGSHCSKNALDTSNNSSCCCSPVPSLMDMHCLSLNTHYYLYRRMRSLFKDTDSLATSGLRLPSWWGAALTMQSRTAGLPCARSTCGQYQVHLATWLAQTKGGSTCLTSVCSAMSSSAQAAHPATAMEGMLALGEQCRMVGLAMGHLPRAGCSLCQDMGLEVRTCHMSSITLS
jgi:hypothetical protein